MNRLKYKIGDKVKVKSKNFLKQNMNKYPGINYFILSLAGKFITIKKITTFNNIKFYTIGEDWFHGTLWADWMFEELIDDKGNFLLDL